MIKKSKSLTTLGETELEIMQHIWEMKEATVSQVHEKMNSYRKVAYTTVMTIMKNLADKDFLSYTKDRVTYVYRPIKSEEEVTSSLASSLIKTVFKSSPAQMVQTLVKQEKISKAEIEELRKLIDGIDPK